uniref:ATP synthase F0 subunit 8 n=1 Tax=Hymenocera picta TaxID=343320 RepID=A0A346RC87_9EUCA|nr:ATP synthase F0 subunit 8 [Hymenocera picta]AXS63684.1 ATP synthase F0 subunit 8 [Hymenocera picta]
MPQMSPLLWFNLYLFFTAVFFSIMIMIFFLKPPIKIKSDIKIKPTPTPNWKW